MAKLPRKEPVKERGRIYYSAKIEQRRRKLPTTTSQCWLCTTTRLNSFFDSWISTSLLAYSKRSGLECCWKKFRWLQSSILGSFGRNDEAHICEWGWGLEQPMISPLFSNTWTQVYLLCKVSTSFTHVSITSSISFSVIRGKVTFNFGWKHMTWSVEWKGRRKRKERRRISTFGIGGAVLKGKKVSWNGWQRKKRKSEGRDYMRGIEWRNMRKENHAVTCEPYDVTGNILFLTLHLPETGSALKSDDGEGPNTSPEAALLLVETSLSIKAGKSLSNVYVD